MKKSIKKSAKKLILLPGFLLMMLLTACGAGADEYGASETPNLDEIMERGYLRVGVFGQSPPFGYMNAAGEHVGRDIYIAHRLAYEMFGDRDSVYFVVTEAANRIPFLHSYMVDVIVANFTVTEERAEQVDFALPYARVALGVIAPEDTDLTSVYDLAGRVVTVTQGTTGQIYLRDNHPDVELLAFPQNTEAFAALADGRADAMVNDNTLLFSLNANNEGFTLVETNLGNPDVIAPAVRQNSYDLLEWLNETILMLREEYFFYHVFEETMAYMFTETSPSEVMYN